MRGTCIFVVEGSLLLGRGVMTCQYCADKYHLMKNIQFNTNVSQCRWIEERQQWRVTSNNNQYLYAQYLVAGYGPLSNAQYLDNIEGIQTFQGDQFHSAKWNTNHSFDKKRVAVIGTGASALRSYSYWTYEVTVLPSVHRWPLRHGLQILMKYNLYSQVRHPELRKNQHLKLN
ncbi:unnamed protein product [Didymodactylos carnosus]|uniref:Flavin-containing monooxygenase n=1 Tax=Didymodactylos carnosus TaxID=1234261 RepID=A0A815GNT2_9BILA|nr:unnamed protein product [Didymodactylos carnosus]CAF4201766.1 unnamed protein product [Didymodactylos carnosus]